MGLGDGAVQTEPWIVELLDLGIGALAVHTLYKLKNPERFAGALTCPRCGYVPRKHAAKCPRCRIPLVRRREGEGV